MLLLALVALAISFAGTKQPTGAQPGSEPSTSAALRLLVDQIKSLFPDAQGDVLDVQGGSITVGIGRRDGLQPRIELSIHREGRELRHPKSGEVLGRAEEPVGRAVVTKVFEAYSVATISGTAAAKPGDKVRVGDGKVKLTLLPVSSGVKDNVVEAALQELINGVGKTGRFHVTMGDQVTVWLASQGLKVSDLLEGKGLEAAAKRFGIDYLLSVEFRTVQRRAFMDARLLAPPQTEPLLATGLFVPAPKPDAQARFSGGPARPERRAPQRSFLARLLWGELEAGSYSAGESSIPLKEVGRFGYPVLAMDVAVSPKDQIPRVVVTDGEKIYVYRVVEGSLAPEWTYGARAGGRILSVQLADLEGDGNFQVVVNRHSPRAGMISAIIGVRNGAATVLVDNLAQIVYAVDASGDGVRRELWEHRYDEEKFFTPGSADRATFAKGRLATQGRVTVPDAFRATGATMSNIAGKDARALVFIDENQYLRVAVGRDEVWRSSTKVGGGFVSAEIRKVDGRVETARYFTMEPSPVSVDLDGDGIEEVIVPQNQQEGFLAIVYKGPAGYRLQSINSGFEGAITALGAIRRPEAGTPSLIASVVRFSSIRKTGGETQIIMTLPD